MPDFKKPELKAELGDAKWLGKASPKSVLYVPQDLENSEREQARKNINAEEAAVLVIVKDGKCQYTPSEIDGFLQSGKKLSLVLPDGTGWAYKPIGLNGDPGVDLTFDFELFTDYFFPTGAVIQRIISVNEDKTVAINDPISSKFVMASGSQTILTEDEKKQARENIHAQRDLEAGLTSADNGKILSVGADGKITAVSVENAEEIPV